MQVGVGWSDHPDSIAAGKQAAQMALLKAERTDSCDLILLFCTAHHNQQLLRNAVVSVLGESECVFGGGAAGVITNDYFGYAGDQVGVACIWLEDSRCTVLSESGLAKGEVETGTRLGKRLLDAGVTPDSSLLLFYDAIDRSRGDLRLLMATWLLEGLEKGMGFLPETMGAGLQGDHACSVTRQYTGAGIEESCAISLAFSDDIRIDSVIMHGCRPASPYYTVTKADGPVILEINGKPALQFIDEVLDSAVEPENYPFFLIFGINHGERWGEYDEGHYASRLCLGIDKERGGIVMFEPDMVEGMEFQIMLRSLELDYMKPKIESIFARLDGQEPLFALYIDCAGRCAGYGGMDIEDALVIQRAVGKDVPLLGIYTGAEISSIGGRPRGLDLTGVFCLFSKKRTGEEAGKNRTEQSLWNDPRTKKEDKESVPLEAMLRLCEQNAAQVLTLDSKSIAIRHELEQKRRGFSLLAELSVSLREGTSDEELLLLVTRRINSALNMQKTAVLFPDADGKFFPRVLQGYNAQEEAALVGNPIVVSEELLDAEHPVLVTAADTVTRLGALRETLRLPYFISAPVVVENEVAALFITGRMVEAAPFLSRLGRSDVETVQAISALLASVLVYRKLGDATRQAQSDALTGLLNRGALETRAVQYLQAAEMERKRYAFMMIDCDCFKGINDRYGHMAGDRVLNTLARFLQKRFRLDDCVARIGGDEFAVLCALGDMEERESILSRIERLVQEWSAQTISVQDGLELSSTISVGIAIAPEDANSYDELFQNADLALYRAKELGRNCCAIYTPQ